MVPSASRPIPREQAASTAGQTGNVPLRQTQQARRQGHGYGQQPQQQQQQQQPVPPWRSSLDLVWSYSRSQAYYAHNINPSPSFVADDRWRGPQDAHWQSDAETDEDDEDSYFDEDGEDEDEATHSTSASPVGADEENTPLWSNDYYNDRSSNDAVPQNPTDPSQQYPNEVSARPSPNEVTPLLSRPAKRLSTSSMRRRSNASGRRKSSSATLYQHDYFAGSSTFGQTLFNCVNALVGIGILSLPIALSYAGLPLGIALFVLAGLVTNYTGKLLWKIMMLSDPRLGIATYADIGRYAFGPRSKVAVTALFCAELWAVGVALIVLFGDSVYALLHSQGGGARFWFSEWPPWAFKIVGFFFVLPTCFMPLRFLSPVSLVGIFTTCSILIIVFTDGLLKSHSPGSLRDPAGGALSATPQWGKLPLAFGLIMSGFSSHPIIPSLVRDMRDPHLFPRMLDLSYLIATVLYLTMGVAGYLMFGRGVSDEITKDLANVAEYPPKLTAAAVGLIAAVSVTKFALVLRPVQSTFEGFIFGGVSGAVQAAEEAVADPDEAEETSGASGTAPAQIAERAETREDLRAMTDATAALARPSISFNQSPLGDLGDVGEGAKPSRSPLSTGALGRRPTVPRRQAIAAWAVRLLLPVCVLLTSLLFPQFASLMSFLGSVLAGLSCICGPLAAHLVVFSPRRATKQRGETLGVPRRVAESFLAALAAVMAVLGTVWAFLPMGQA